MILSAVIMAGVKSNTKISDVDIYNKAKAMGMDYPENFKVIDNGGKSK